MHERLLLGTAFTQVVLKCFHDTKKTHMLIYALSSKEFFEEVFQVEDNYPGKKNVLFFNVTDMVEKVYSESSFNICHLSLLQGMLNVKNKDFLLSKIVRSDGSIQPFIVMIQNPIYTLCKQGDRYLFQSFTLLLSCLRTIKDLQPLWTNTETTNKSLVLDFESIVSLVKSNWENQLHGFPELTQKVLQEALSVVVEDGDISNKEVSHLTSFYLDVMSMSWKLKGKFLSLECLVSHIGSLKHLTTYPETVKHIFLAFLSNKTTVAAVRVYKALVGDMLSCCSRSEAVEWWQKIWSKAVLENLNSSERVVSQNISTHILPWTIRTLPETLNALHQVLLEVEPMRNPLSHVTLNRIARQAGQLSLENIDTEDINAWLHHSSDSVRLEALSLLCSTPQKKIEKPIDLELCLVKDFLRLNLNIDCPAFRNSLYQNIRMFLVRIRDFLLQLIPKQSDKLDHHLGSISFVDWLWRYLLSNLFPGSSYQRRQTCLSLLTVIMETFTFQNEMKGRKKGVPSEKISLLVKMVQERRNKWTWFSNGNCFIIIHCLWDRVNEIQQLACELIVKYFPAWSEDHNELRQLLYEAYALCGCPRSQEFNTAAQLIQIAFKKLIWEGKARISLYPGLTFELEPSSCKESLALSFLENLFLWAQYQFQCIKKNISIAAKETPLHGIILSLNLCLSDQHIVPCLLNASEPTFSQLMLKIMDLCKEVVSRMLNIMASKTSKDDAAPSFEEIELALEEFCESGENPDFLNEEVQVLLSCCWINLKECCHLISTTCQIYISMKNVDLPVIMSSLEVFIDVLTKCRHRGAIEACCLSFTSLCRSIVRTSSVDGTNILRSLLVQEFEQFRRSFSSLTRRSAGLPLLVQAVVASELPYSERELLVLSMDTLLKMAKGTETERDDDGHHIEDDPRTHSLHILKVLFNDAQISRDLLAWVEQVFVLCGDAFTSPSWSVRNGALQLYGALVLRLVGQRSSTSAKSVSIDIFYRYPLISKFILAQLQAAADDRPFTDTGLLLMPLLSLLCAIIPSQTITSKESRCPSEDYIQVLKPLLRSKQWPIRSLTAVALTSFLVDSAAVTFAQELLLECERMITSQLCFNYVHGILLTVCEILKLPMDANDGLRILTAFLRCKWLGSVQNECSVVRVLYLRILLEMKMLIGHHEEILLLSKEFVTNHKQIVDPKLCKEEVTLILQELCADELVKSSIKFMDAFYRVNKESFDAVIQVLLPAIPQVACLDILHDLHKFLVFVVPKTGHINSTEHLLELLSSVHQALPEKSLIGLLSDDSSCVKLIIECCGQKHSPSVRNKSFQLWSTWIQRASADPILCLEEWLQVVISTCSPEQLQDTRLCGAEGILMAGRKVFTWLVDSQQHLMLCRFSDCILQALQDEDPDVRATIATFVSSLIHQDKACYHSNKALTVFSNWLVTQLSTNPCVLNYYWEKFSQPLSSLDLRSQEKQRVVLFEQEDHNPYAEPPVLVEIYKIILQDLLERSEKASLLMTKDWISSKDVDFQQHITELFTILPSVLESPSKQFCIPNTNYLCLFKAYHVIGLIQEHLDSTKYIHYKKILSHVLQL